SRPGSSPRRGTGIPSAAPSPPATGAPGTRRRTGGTCAGPAATACAGRTWWSPLSEGSWTKAGSFHLKDLAGHDGLNQGLHPVLLLLAAVRRLQRPEDLVDRPPVRRSDRPAQGIGQHLLHESADEALLFRQEGLL